MLGENTEILYSEICVIFMIRPNLLMGVRLIVTDLY